MQNKGCMKVFNIPQKVCQAFGYTEPIQVNSLIASAKWRKTVELVNNNELSRCIMCGNCHKIGYRLQNKGALSQIIEDSFNEAYAFKAKSSDFICEYCVWASKNYNKLKMLNIIVANDYKKAFIASSGVDNELYDILLNPPEPPFAILINSRGKVLENMVFSAKASVSKELICIQYGTERTLWVNVKKIFECVEQGYSLINKHGVNDDFFFNRTASVEFQLKSKLFNKEEDHEILIDLKEFLKSFGRDTRIVAKMILKRWLFENKDKAMLIKSKTQTYKKGIK